MQGWDVFAGHVPLELLMIMLLCFPFAPLYSSGPLCLNLLIHFTYLHLFLCRVISLAQLQTQVFVSCPKQASLFYKPVSSWSILSCVFQTQKHCAFPHGTSVLAHACPCFLHIYPMRGDIRKLPSLAVRWKGISRLERSCCAAGVGGEGEGGWGI